MEGRLFFFTHQTCSFAIINSIMSEKNFGEALRGPSGEKRIKKEGREAPPIPHDEETAEEAERLSGRKRPGIEDVPGRDLSPEEKMILKETLKVVMDPKNKNSR